MPHTKLTRVSRTPKGVDFRTVKQRPLTDAENQDLKWALASRQVEIQEVLEQLENLEPDPTVVSLQKKHRSLLAHYDALLEELQSS